MNAKSRREIIALARKVVFEDEQPEFDFNRSSNSTNDARVGFKHAWESQDGLRPVLNVVETGAPAGSNASLGGSKLLYILQPSSTSIDTANRLMKLETEWVKHFSRQVLREKPRKEANNPTPEVYSIHSIMKRGKIDVVRDGLRNGVYSGMVILDRRNHSKKIKIDEFSFEWDGAELTLCQLLNDISTEVGQRPEHHQSPHFFLSLLTNAFEYHDLDDLDEQYLDLLEGRKENRQALNMSLALPLAPENIHEKYAFEMASLFDLTNRLAEGIKSLDFALVESQNEITSRLQRRDQTEIPYSSNYLDASVVSNSSFLYFRTLGDIGASPKKNAGYNLTSLMKPLQSLEKIPELWDVYQRGKIRGHLTYEEAGAIERVIQKIWRSGQVLLNQTRLLHDHKSILFAINCAYLMDKAAPRGKSLKELPSIPLETIEQIWDSYNHEDELALFTYEVWMYGRHNLPNDGNQMRSIRSILYNPSSRGYKFFHTILELLNEIGHDAKSLDDFEDCMDEIFEGERVQGSPMFQPAHYCLILQEDFLNALEKAIGCHRYLYATSTELGWGSRWMGLFKVFDKSSIVSIGEIESKFLQPLNDVLSNLPDGFSFKSPQLDWPTDQPKWDSMLIKLINEWLQGGITND